MNLKKRKFQLLRNIILYLLAMITFIEANEKDMACNSYLSEAEYTQAFGLLSKTSSQASFTINKITEDILPNLSEKQTFLDIGAGFGNITKEIAPFFSKVTVVEPNGEFRKFYEKESYQIYQDSFEDCQITSTFDFCLASHVLYHVVVSDYPKFLSKFIRCLNPNGKGLLVMFSAKGKLHEFFSKLKPSYGNSSQIIEYFKENKISFSVDAFANKFHTQHFAEMHTLIRFFAYENCFQAEELVEFTSKEFDKINKTIEEFAKQCMTKKGLYELKWIDDLIEINP